MSAFEAMAELGFWLDRLEEVGEETEAVREP